ncbi:MAG: LptF/LptG family permease [Candidatus Omnitrophica bacterium]|nr:LptF/LptG family permease [Candidatus Omnitrophota bacterium]
MRLVDRYVFRSFLAPLLYCFFIFIALYIVIDLFAYIEEIIKQHVRLKVLIVYYLAYLPTIIAQMAPIAMLIAAMQSLGSLARHNELIAMRAGGLSMWQILKPLVMTGLLVSLFVLVLNDRVIPRSTQVFMKIREEQLERKKTGSSATKILRDVAIYGIGNKIIFARSFDPKTNVLKNVIIHNHDRRQNIISKTIAREARWNKSRWVAFSMTTYKIDRTGQIIGEPVFLHRGDLDISEGPADFIKQKYNIEGLGLGELRKHIKRLSGTSGSVIRNLKMEMYNRVSYSFANLVAVIIGAAFCLRATRSSRFMGIGLGLLIGLLFYGVFGVCSALGKGGILPPFLAAWGSNIIFSIIGIRVINRL